MNVRRLLIAAGVVASLTLVYVLRGVLAPLFLAFLIAYALDPLVDRLVRIGVPRAVAAPVVAALAFLGLGAAAIVVIPVIVHELGEASQRLPERVEALRGPIQSLLWDRFQIRIPESSTELVAGYGALIRANLPDAAAVAHAIFGTVDAILSIIGLLVVPVFSSYLLVDFDRIVLRADALVPRRFSSPVREVATETHAMLGRYARGQLLACLVLAALYAGALGALGIRMGVLIGVITGLLAFIPYVGLLCGITLALAMSLLETASSAHLAAVLMAMGVVALLDAMLITPRIVGGSVGLRPLEALLAVLTAGTLFGFLGVLLAVPLGGVVKILVRRATRAYLASQFYGGKPLSSSGDLASAAANVVEAPQSPPAGLDATGG